ncbi:MAG: hypothetical protein LBT46_03830, partial [Planctomycetaceae bacterium]|nr:hypothetical protein [Planctomycetaceae bacterium]
MNAKFFAALTAAVTITAYAAASPAAEPDVIFCIGTPDSHCDEFALVKEGYAAFPAKFPNEVVYQVGKSSPKNDWAFVHPAKEDISWAKGGTEHPFTIQFDSDNDIAEQTAFIIGYCGNMNDKLSDIKVTVNGTDLPVQQPKLVGNSEVVFNPRRKGQPAQNIFAIPGGLLKKGTNSISIVLQGKSWILYDYVALRKEAKPLALQEKPEFNLFAEFQKNEMKDVKKIVFTTRTQTQEHWYANFGYYAHNQYIGDNPPAPNEGGKLCVYDIGTKQVEVLIDDVKGLVRDPCVHYDGKKILYSYKPAGTNYFHLYEMDLGSNNSVRQITNDPFDDIEPVYTPDDKIIFVSSRAKRWVNCWMTQVAILHGCNLDGSNIRVLSGNIEQDNTPWILPNGQVLYMRWEYVDRSQVHYHHLWTMNPDGTRQMVYFGNMHAGGVFIDAKPIPGSDKIVASFERAGHGGVEHNGWVAVIDPRNGPDDRNMAQVITQKRGYRDPWAFSENAFMAAFEDKIVLIDRGGEQQTLFTIPKDWQSTVSAGKVIRDKTEIRANLSALLIHEPRPLTPHPRERVIGDAVNPSKETGKLTLIDVYHGRNMTGIKRGEIKKLLIIETLP